jgi:hypothetical protein
MLRHTAKSNIGRQQLLCLQGWARALDKQPLHYHCNICAALAAVLLSRFRPDEQVGMMHDVVVSSIC